MHPRPIDWAIIFLAIATGYGIVVLDMHARERANAVEIEQLRQVEVSDYDKRRSAEKRERVDVLAREREDRARLKAIEERLAKFEGDKTASR